MMPPETGRWTEQNQRYMSRAIAGIRERLQGEGDDVRQRAALAAIAEAMPAPPAIEMLRRAFGLSDFERDLLLLCAGVELDAVVARACASAAGGPEAAAPTFSVAMSALAAPHWSALSPAAPLRRWRMIEVLDGRALSTSPLRIDERVLHHLVGIQYLDERLAGIVRIAEPEAGLAPSHQRVAQGIVNAWAAGVDAAVPPVIELLTAEPVLAEAIASLATGSVGLQLAVMRAADIPASARERDELTRILEREAAIGALALLVDCRDPDAAPADTWPAAHLVGRVASPVMVAAQRRLEVEGRQAIHLPVAPLDRQERRDLWERELGAQGAGVNGQLGHVVEQFAFGAADIRSISADLRARPGDSGGDAAETLWELCRRRSRPGMDGLAQRIDAVATWDDLVLPPAQAQVLRDIAVHVRQRGRVYHDWGFAGVSHRGLGTSALFAGPSGTGKTMAAEVLANELRLDLYRIDLSQVVSKYIGETEKNLSRLFDAAEGGGVILLFDEADALFGKRSEVRDSHDRYANIEVSYLLQRMETYRGLAILTTNLKDALDTAFLRRIRFVVQFPFPDAEARAAIWERTFPADTPREGLDTGKLARLSVAGGNIRNIALNAAFLAADENVPVGMRHLLQAARAEAIKVERPISDAEIRGWVEPHERARGGG